MKRSFNNIRVQRKYDYYLNSDKINPESYSEFNSTAARAFAAGFKQEPKPDFLGDNESFASAAYYGGYDRKQKLLDTNDQQN